MDQKDVMNILVVGEPCMGKSSFINLLLQQNQIQAIQGDDLRGVTKKIQMYETKILKQNKNVRIYDFPGFGDYEVDIKAIFEQWNQIIAQQKIDLIFYCQLYTHKRINLVPKLGLEAIIHGAEFKKIEENFILVITGIDYAKNDADFQNFRNKIVDKEMIPRLKEILNMKNFDNRQVIYSTTEDQNRTVKQVQDIIDRYQMNNGVIAQIVEQSFIEKLLKKISEFFKKCISLNCTIITSEGAKKMRELKIGDRIKISQNNMQKEDEIVAFIHLNQSFKTQFLKIIFDNDEYITLTNEHLIYLSTQFCQAKTLRLGDEIQRFNGEQYYKSRIKQIEQIEEIGFISPLSSSGVMTINDCIVSCYSQCSTQQIGDISTWPIRKLRIFRYVFQQNSDEEIHPYFKLLMGINKYMRIA